METNLILLLISAAIKAAVLTAIASLLIKKWQAQPKSYYTDFPFLMALTFIVYAIGKVFDIYLYYTFSNTPNIADLTAQNTMLYAKTRYIITVGMVAPYLVLMLIIWFGGKWKQQWAIGGTWATISIGGVFLVRNYSQMLLLSAFTSLVPIMLSIVTFGIIHHQRKLPEINSLFLAIGWSAFIVGQLIRPMWATMGSGVWGLTWMGELVELAALVVIATGFFKKASYYFERQKIQTKGENPSKEPEVLAPISL